MSEVEKAHNELVAGNGAGVGLEEGLDVLIQHFLLSQDIKPSSKGAYHRGLRQFMTWLAQSGDPKPTRQTILAYKAFLEGKGLSALTISSYLVVRRFFEWAAGVKLTQGKWNHPIVKMHRWFHLEAQAKADADSLVNLLEIGRRQATDLAVKANLVNGANLREQDDGVFLQSCNALRNMHVHRVVLGKALGRERCHDDCGCRFVSNVVLNHDDRPTARLL